MNTEEDPRPSAPYYLLPNANASPAPYLAQAHPPPPFPLPHLHGYVMGTEPPKGPLRVFDISTIENPQKLPFLDQIDGYDRNRKRRGFSVAILVTYIVGMITFVPHIVSIALSLHLVKTGQIQKRRSEVLWFSFIELSMWLICACLSWGYSVYGWNDQYGYEQRDVFYWGWILIVAWFFFGLAFGIPRVVFCWNSNPQSEAQFLSQKGRASPEQISPRRFRNLKLACFVTFVMGFVFLIPELVSIGFSLYMLKKGLIATKKQAAVLACSVLELVGWFIAATMSWLFVTYCSNPQSIEGSYYYNGIWNSESDSAYDYWYDNYLQCQPSLYIGWIFIAVWGLFAISFGTARVIMTSKSQFECADKMGAVNSCKVGAHGASA